MRRTFVPAAVIFIVFLAGCATTGWVRRLDPRVDQDTRFLGSVQVTRTYWHPLFIGRSSVAKRLQLDEMLLAKAREQHGPTAEITNITYESSWNAASLLFYFSMMGFVETASARADVFDPVQQKVASSARRELAQSVGSEVTLDRPRFSTPNSADGVDFSVTVCNVGDRDLKYLRLWLEAYNRVNDRVRDTVRDEYTARLEITGPIRPNAPKVYQWDNVFYNPTAVTPKVVKLEIVYMDNSTTVIGDRDQIGNNIVRE